MGNHGGNSTKTDLKDGIRYIQYNNSQITTPEQISNIDAIEFVVNGSNITNNKPYNIAKPRTGDGSLSVIF